LWLKANFGGGMNREPTVMHVKIKFAIAIATCWLATAASPAVARDTPEPPLADAAGTAPIPGPSAVLADFGTLVMGAGASQDGAGSGNGGGAIPLCPNCNGPIGSLTFGPGGTQSFDWQINDAGPSLTHPTAPGVAGFASPQAPGGQISGWSLLGAQMLVNPITHTTSSGNLTWSATSTAGSQFNFLLET
jgi:hypothetical protein